jgi:hypothetical protein
MPNTLRHAALTYTSDMPLLFLTAQAVSASLSLQEILGLLGGSTLLTGVAVLVARGYWAKTITPMIEVEIRRWHGTREQVEEREKEMQHMLRAPAVVSEMTQAMKLVIDNEIKRSDGLIHHEIRTQVDNMESRVLSKLDEMTQLQREDSALKHKILQEMGQLKGAIAAITGQALPSATISPPSPPERHKMR